MLHVNEMQAVTMEYCLWVPENFIAGREERPHVSPGLPAAAGKHRRAFRQLLCKQGQGKS